MPVIERISQMAADMTQWRRHLHAHPEIAYQEVATSAFVAGLLREWGVDVHEGLAGTGVVGTLTTGEGPTIALRADMDALPIEESNTFSHRSTHAGCMHACGHDGHTAMLLGAARFLAETRHFQGTIRFIFQPAEENEAGARKMIEDGLFRLFPVDAVYGMHNWPGLATGRFAVRPGPMMAAFDRFEIVVTGAGGHAAMPHHGTDPIVTASAIVGTLQTIVSRSTDPLDAAVVTVTQFHSGDTWNVIPETAVLRGTTRSLRPEVQARLEAAVCRVACRVAEAHGATAAVRYDRCYPATINDRAASDHAAMAIALVVGDDCIDRDLRPSMGAEDFAFMLEQRPGCYIWIGNGDGDGTRGLHSPGYDFNDAILPFGASYWAKLVETVLRVPARR